MPDRKRNLRISLEGVYAVGDLVSIDGGPHLRLAHVGFAEGILVAEQTRAVAEIHRPSRATGAQPSRPSQSGDCQERCGWHGS